MFSFKAFRHAWRHGEDAQLVTQPDPPAVLHVVREELYEVPLIPEPELPPPPPPVSADKMTVDTAPFCVMDEGGNVYIGGSGGDAKRAIENLRARGVEWQAFRFGEQWCESA